MAEINESERFAILKQASETLEHDFRRLQAEKNVVMAQISEQRKELADVMATIAAAKIKRDRSLEVMAHEQAQEESALRQRSEVLRVEVMQLESSKAIREKELRAVVDGLSADVAEKRQQLSLLNQSVREQETKLVDIRSAVNALKSTLIGVTV